MASEDSEQLGPGFLAIHRLSDLHNLSEPLKREVAARLDHLDTAGELLEVLLLRRVHGIRPEKRNDRFDQVRSPPDNVSIQVLAMVVVPLVCKYLTHPEKALELVQTCDALGALRHGELMSHLVAGSVAASTTSARLADEAD